MTEHIDRGGLRDAAEGHLRYGGGGDDLADGVLALLDHLDQAEARIQAVRDVLAHHPYGGPGQEDAIRRALDAP